MLAAKMERAVIDLYILGVRKWLKYQCDEIVERRVTERCLRCSEDAQKMETARIQRENILPLYAIRERPPRNQQPWSIMTSTTIV